jgi:hypothetical protein
MSQRSNITPSALWGLPLLNIFFGLGLCVIHAHAETVDPAIDSEAEQTMGAWDRITSGPFHWSAMDKVLFFALIMLALEILNFLCNHSGGTKENVSLLLILARISVMYGLWI